MDQRIIDLYHRFTHGGMNRRQFLDRLTEMVGSAAAAAALVPLLQNDYAKAAIVAPNDARLVSERVTYDSPKGKISGYLVRGKDKMVLEVTYGERQGGRRTGPGARSTTRPNGITLAGQAANIQDQGTDSQ